MAQANHIWFSLGENLPSQTFTGSIFWPLSGMMNFKLCLNFFGVSLQNPKLWSSRHRTAYWRQKRTHSVRQSVTSATRNVPVPGQAMTSLGKFQGKTNRSGDVDKNIHRLSDGITEQVFRYFLFGHFKCILAVHTGTALKNFILTI